MGATVLLLTAVMLAPPDRPTTPRTPPPPAPAAGAAAELFHTALDHTMPADGDTLRAAPDRVELVFTGPIEDDETSVVLLSPDGSSRTLEIRTTGDETPTVSAAVPSLGPGGYRVDWRVLSPDGHPLEGTFVFYVDVPPAGASDAVEGATAMADADDEAGGLGTEMEEGGDPAAEAASGEAGTARDGRTDEGGGGDSALAPAPASGQDERAGESGGTTLILTSAGINLALLGLAGLLGFATWGPIPPGARTLRAALGLAAAASVLLPAEAWLWTGRALGGDPGTGDRIEALVGLTSGRSIAVRLGLSWVALWALAVSRRVRLSAVLAAVAVAVGALGGHPAATSPGLAQPANAVHLLAASAWAGGLLYIVTQRSSVGHDQAIRRVSTVALVSVVLVALTGVFQGWLFLDSVTALFGTSYGRLVLAKAAGLLVLVGFGAVHRLRLIPAIEEDRDTGPVTRAVRMELAVAGVVVVVAAVLAHVSPVAS